MFQNRIIASQVPEKAIFMKQIVKHLCFSHLLAEKGFSKINDLQVLIMKH